jgi:hypothetical protein
MGLGNVQRASIPIYRRAEVREAIAKNKPIFLVDGEQCADILWRLDLYHFFKDVIDLCKK